MQEIYLIACLKSSTTTHVTFIKLRRRIFNYIVEIIAFLFVTRGSLIKKIIIAIDNYPAVPTLAQGQLACIVK